MRKIKLFSWILCQLIQLEAIAIYFLVLWFEKWILGCGPVGLIDEPIDY